MNIGPKDRLAALSRPSGTANRQGRYQHRVLAVTVLALVGALLASSCASSGRQIWAQAPPSQPYATASLRNLVGKSMVPSVVGLADGYDAAAYDQRGHIDFWQQRGTGPWHEASRCAYQVVLGNGPPYMFRVTGRQLPGMADATFIALGEFTGDTSGNFIAFTRGKKGWGAIVPQGHGGLAPIGCSDSDDIQGERLREGFSGGELQTVGMAAMPEILPSVTDWRWQRGHFVVAGGNAFRSVLTSGPGERTSDQGPCHAWASGAQGSYDGYLQALSGSDWANVPTPDLQVLMSSRPGAASCLLTLSPTTSLVVEATRAWAGHGGLVWVTAPAWWLEGGVDYPDYRYVVTARRRAYRIRSALGVPIGPWATRGTRPSGVYCQLNLRGGVVTSIALLPGS